MSPPSLYSVCLGAVSAGQKAAMGGHPRPFVVEPQPLRRSCQHIRHRCSLMFETGAINVVDQWFPSRRVIELD